MATPRRALLALGAAAAAPSATAQTGPRWSPERPVAFLGPFAAGGLST